MRDKVVDTAFHDEGVDNVVNAARWRAAHIDGLVRLVKKFQAAGLDVVVVGPAPEYDRDFPLVLAQSMMAVTSHSTQYSLVEDRFRLDETMRATLAGLPVKYISLIDLICPSGNCRALSSTQSPMQFDYGHLTLSAARDLAPEIIS
jgi:hypothetical protein